jgi:hypothetical protein
MINNKNGGLKMKELNIVDLVALATFKPELFKDKDQLQLILNVKKNIINVLIDDFKKEELQ